MGALDGLGISTAIAAAEENSAAEKEVGQADFLKLLVAQLQNQDPLNPQDSAAFASQLAQFSSVEQLIAMRAGIEELVANSTSQSGGSDTSTNGLNPTSLIGREVVVFGSQIEVDAAQSDIRLPIRTIEDVTSATVRIYDVNGVLRHEESIVDLDANGNPIALRAGDNEYVFSPSDRNLPEGVYAIEFQASGPNGEDVTILPLVSGLVTGAILTGDPAIRIGSRIFSIEDILEVRLSEQTDSNSNANVRTGGGQTVLQQPAPRTTS